MRDNCPYERMVGDHKWEKTTLGLPVNTPARKHNVTEAELCKYCTAYRWLYNIFSLESHDPIGVEYESEVVIS